MSESRRALVTGITGQDGSYLAELLLAKGYEVWGLVRRSSVPSTGRIEHLLAGPDAERVHLITGHLGDAASLARAVRSASPREIYNLAAQSDVKASFDVPTETALSAGLGALRLLEVVRDYDPTIRFYQASSSEMFGKVVETPQNEDTPFYPRSPYAVAKVFAFHAVRNYREAWGLFAVNGILFNHESPRRGEGFVTRKISRAVAQIRAGRQELVALGNLDARRDWGFAGDYVDAMWRMLQADEPEDFVVATGQSHSVRDFCTLAFAHADMPLDWEGEGKDEVGRDAEGVVRVAVDREYFRPTEVDFLIGDAARARAVLDWEPTTSFEELVRMMVDADLAAVGR